MGEKYKNTLNFKEEFIMKQSLLLFGFLVLTLIISGCVQPTTKPRTVSEYMPKFDFTPPSYAPANSADVTFALVSPAYQGNQKWMSVPPFNLIPKNMSKDFEELLIAKGFTIKGPFRNYEEMTYHDKKNSDLILVPDLEIGLNFSQLQVITKQPPLLSLRTTPTYSLGGNVIISGRVSLNVLESLTGEKMWTKSVDIPSTTVYIEGEKEYNQPVRQIDFSDKGIFVPIAKKIKKIYDEIMKTSWKYLDPEEMSTVKKESLEIRKKKVY